jgi:large subunit ribosomal protein L9
MKVILLEDVTGKGKAGDVVKVNDGYARNYLLPRELAVLADATNMKNLEHRRTKLAEQRAKNKEEAEGVKARLDGISVMLKTVAGEGGRLFGSITSQDIADAVDQQHKITLDKRKIQLDAHIKEIGIHPVDVKLFPEVTATIRVVVATESGETSVTPPVEAASAETAEEAAPAATDEAETAAEEIIDDAEFEDDFDEDDDENAEFDDEFPDENA